GRELGRPVGEADLERGRFTDPGSPPVAAKLPQVVAGDKHEQRDRGPTHPRNVAPAGSDALRSGDMRGRLTLLLAALAVASPAHADSPPPPPTPQGSDDSPLPAPDEAPP